MTKPDLDALPTATAKLVRLWLWHYGPARSGAQIEKELGISHKALWEAKKTLLEHGIWTEKDREITTPKGRAKP